MDLGVEQRSNVGERRVADHRANLRKIRGRKQGRRGAKRLAPQADMASRNAASADELHRRGDIQTLEPGQAKALAAPDSPLPRRSNVSTS